MDLCGQISRDLAKSRPRCRKVKECIEVGEPTPNEIIVPAVNALLAKNSLGGGFVFDGYPRFANQIEPLVVAIEERGWEVTKVIVIDLPEDEALKGLLSGLKVKVVPTTLEIIARRLALYHERHSLSLTILLPGKSCHVDGQEQSKKSTSAFSVLPASMITIYSPAEQEKSRQRQNYCQALAEVKKAVAPVSQLLILTPSSTSLLPRLVATLPLSWKKATIMLPVCVLTTLLSMAFDCLYS